MPPRPIIGIDTALYILYTFANAIGLIAGPDRPPRIVLILGLLFAIQFPCQQLY